MKKLKSLLAALLAVTMALTATACGNTDGQQEGGVSTSIDPSTVLEENSDVIHAFGGGSSGGGYYHHFQTSCPSILQTTGSGTS